MKAQYIKTQATSKIKLKTKVIGIIVLPFLPLLSLVVCILKILEKP